MDVWHGCLSLSRQYLRGWSANKTSEARKNKEMLLHNLEKMDQVNGGQLDVAHWTERYKLENELEQLYSKEDLYWQQRSSDR
jgi:hypothetical protein